MDYEHYFAVNMVQSCVCCVINFPRPFAPSNEVEFIMMKNWKGWSTLNHCLVPNILTVGTFDILCRLQIKICTTILHHTHLFSLSVPFCGWEFLLKAPIWGILIAHGLSNHATHTNYVLQADTIDTLIINIIWFAGRFKIFVVFF